MSVIAPSAVGRDRSGPADFPCRLFRVEGRLTELITIGLFPEGLRMQRSFEGRIVAGQPAGALVCGVEEFIIRPDGTGVIDARQVISANAGPSGGDQEGVALKAPGRGWLSRRGVHR